MISVTSAVLIFLGWSLAGTRPAPDARPVAGSPPAGLPPPSEALPRLEGVVLSVDPESPVIEVSVQGSRFRTALPEGAPLDLSRGRGVTLEDVRFVEDGPEGSHLTAGKVEFRPETR